MIEDDWMWAIRIGLFTFFESGKFQIMFQSRSQGSPKSLNDILGYRFPQGPLRPGPRVGTDGLGQYKMPIVQDSRCAKRGRAPNRFRIIV